ncbi:hypothetical protein PseAD21_27855 [Pseudomonas sp. AD21]|nr:hypothetical protein PseAD21_27855 [Pseudomonas sp. AD21]
MRNALRPGAAIEFNHRHGQRRQALAQIVLGQNRHRRAVAEQVVQTLGRVCRVNRHITGASLEDRHQSDQRVQPATGNDGDSIIGFHPAFDQVMRQSVGLTVEFGVGQLAVGTHRRHCLRPLGHPCLETLVNGQGVAEFNLSRIEAEQHLRKLRRRQDRQLIDRRLRRLLQREHEVFQRAVQVVADALRIGLRAGQQGQAERVTEVIDAQGQRIVAALLGVQRGDTVPRREGLRTGTGDVVAVAIIEQRAEQRRWRHHVTAALGQGQRRMFVAHQRGQACMRGVDRRTHVLAVDIHPQRQGIDENSQRAVNRLGTLHAPHQHRAEHHLLLAGERRQHLRPTEVKQARDTDPERPRLRPQALTEQRFDRHAQFDDVAAVTLHVLQTVGQRRLVDGAEHVAEKCLVFGFADAQSCLGHVIAERHRASERLTLSGEAGTHFMTHHVEGRVIEGHVMEQQRGDHPLPGLIPGVGQAHQRRASHVEAEVPSVEAFVQIRQNIAVGVWQQHRFHRQFGPTPDHLHRRVQPLPEHRSAQDVVAIDHRLQRLGERLKTLTAGKCEVRLHDIRVALTATGVVIKDAFLQRRQRVNVLHIGRAAGHLLDQTVNGHLVEFDQGQHRRGDAGGARDNAIGRHLDLAVFGGRVLPGLDQLDQCRFVLAQQHQQGRVVQRLLVAVDPQLVVRDRQLDIFSLQCGQQFDHVHRTISIRSVIAA